MEPKRYDEDAARRILEQASALQLRDQTTTFSRDQLSEMAQELDIAPEYLQLAEKSWLEEQERKQPRRRAAVARPQPAELAAEQREACHGPNFRPIVPLLFFFMFIGIFGGVFGIFGGNGFFFGAPFPWILIPVFFFAFGSNRRHARHHRR